MKESGIEAIDVEYWLVHTWDVKTDGRPVIRAAGSALGGFGDGGWIVVMVVGREERQGKMEGTFLTCS